jgi:hypothetical protein
VHPSSSARSRSGFAGLRLVPPHSAGDEPEPVTFTVQILVQDGRVSIEWDPKTPDVVRPLNDVGDVVAAACAALMRGQDVETRIQAAYDRKRSWREHAEAQKAEYERTHPWVCACGKRCKSPGGLTSHQRTGGPTCG